MWVKPEDLVEMQAQDDSHLDKLHAMRVHPKLKHKYAPELSALLRTLSYMHGSAHQQ